MYLRIFADCNSTHCAVIYTLSSSHLYHCHESMSIQWSDFSLNLFYLILVWLLFLFCDIICIFIDNVEDLKAVQSLLITWVIIESASTLLNATHSYIIIITEKNNESITQALLNKNFFLLKILNKTLFSFIFADISISWYSLNKLSLNAHYLNLHANITRELNLTQIV